MIPMSSTAGGGGGGGGGNGLAGFFVAVAPGFGLGFELVAAGFFVEVDGFDGAGAWADETVASRHAATRAAARFEARDDRASMAADSTRGAAFRAHNIGICDVTVPAPLIQLTGA